MLRMNDRVKIVGVYNELEGQVLPAHKALFELSKSVGEQSEVSLMKESGTVYRSSLKNLRSWLGASSNKELGKTKSTKELWRRV